MSAGDLRWALRHAWRDARSSRRRLFLYMAAIIAGVAALVAIRSFADNLTASVDTQARTLLGADLELYRREPFDPEALTVADQFVGERLQEISLGTMAYFPASRDSRLVRLRAVEPGYPFYGELESMPADATVSMHDQGGALVDRTLLLQFGAAVGDRVGIGALELPIVGALDRIPGEVPTASLVGPRVLIPLPLLEGTGLLGPGSQARYSLQFRLSEAPDAVTERVERLRPRLRELRIEAETVQYRQRVVGRALDTLYDFLYLSGFAALLLGGIGVGSAMALHARDQVTPVAVLRCIGAPRWLPVQAYLLQALAMAAAGAAVGASLGVVAQRLLPLAVGPFLPLTVEFALSPGAIGLGMFAGLAVAVLFAALPLLPLRRVTPLEALRLFATSPRLRVGDPWLVGPLLALVATLCLVVWVQTGETGLALGVVGSLVAVLAALALTALGLRRGARVLLRLSASYPVRQGVTNLYRPRNQTLVVLVSLGFGTFVIGCLLVLQASLLANVQGLADQGEANFVLFDVQPDQADGARAILERNGLPVLQEARIVPMRLRSLRGRSVADLAETGEAPGWALRREYNSTYRATLTEGETIQAGEWVGSSGSEAPPVSIEAGLAEDLGLTVGDALEFDIQGIAVPVVVGSLREVDWEQVRPNFFVVFPTGVLEDAPQQIAIVGRAETPAMSAAVQRDLVERYRNVSVIDLGLVLRTIDDVLDQVRLAVRFMTLFILGAGAAVLLVAVRTSRDQRQRESVLLRTLGASRRQILTIQGAEYFCLGGLAAATGLLLSVVASAALCEFALELEPVVPTPALAALGALILSVTLGVGLWGARGTTTRPPREVLRARR